MKPTETAFELTLLRHAESTGNARQLIQGQLNYPLTPKGIAQAQSLAARWNEEDKTFLAAVSSPLSRARQTAEVITGTLGLGITLDPRWMERDYGSYSGKSRDALKQHRNQEPATALDAPIGETGESLKDLYHRAESALNWLLKRPPGNYLVVSHGGILNAMLSHICKIDIFQYAFGVRFRFENCAFATVRYQPWDCRWLILGVNDHQHLANLEPPKDTFR